MKKIAALTVAAAMVCSLASGCGASKLDGTKTVVTVNGTEIPMGVLSVAVRSEQAQMENIYKMYFGAGMSIWDGADEEEGTYGNATVKNILKQLELGVISKEKASEYGVEIPEELSSSMKEAAKAFMAANSEETLAELAVTEDQVVQYLELETYRDMVYHEYVERAEVVVTDEEANQTSFLYTSIPVDADEETAEEEEETTAEPAEAVETPKAEEETAEAAETPKAEEEAAEAPAEVSATPEAEEAAEPSVTPEAEEAAEVSVTPEAEEAAEPSATPEAEEAAEPSATPGAEEAAEVSVTPEAEEAAEVSVTPGAEEAAEVSVTPEASVTPAVVSVVPEVSEAPAEEEAPAITAAEKAQKVLEVYNGNTDADQTALREAVQAVDDSLYVYSGHFTTASEDNDTSYPDAVLEVLRSLTDGQVGTEVIETEDNLYVVRLEKVLDEDQTESTRTSLENTKKQDAYTEESDKWIADASIKVADKVLKKLTLTDKHTFTVITPEPEETEEADGETVEDFDEEAVEVIDDMEDTAEEAGEIVEDAADAAEDTVDAAAETAAEAAETAEETADAAAETAETAADTGKASN
ncbi:MAG: hypothetical protein IIY55_05820 [Blautia sp.]|nr:hypothetical protein [Blautia sp.]